MFRRRRRLPATDQTRLLLSMREGFARFTPKRGESQMSHRDGSCGCAETFETMGSPREIVEAMHACGHAAWHETLIEHYGADLLSKCHRCKLEREGGS